MRYRDARGRFRRARPDEAHRDGRQAARRAVHRAVRTAVRAQTQELRDTVEALFQNAWPPV